MYIFAFFFFYRDTQSMGENPTRMHSHVMRTMFSHAQCYNIFGPVFFQIKKALEPQWVQPHSLQQLCRKSIRRSLFRGCRSNAHPDTVTELNLPKSLESYISYHNWRSSTARPINIIIIYSSFNEIIFFFFFRTFWSDILLGTEYYNVIIIIKI